MYNTIIGKLKTILEGIAGIQAVYDHEPATTTNYPFVSITPVSRSSSLFSMGAGYNERAYSFMVRVYVNTKDATEEAQEVLRTIAGLIDDAFESQENITLGGTISYSELTDGAFKFMAAETGLYVYEVTYKAKVHFNRNG